LCQSTLTHFVISFRKMQPSKLVRLAYDLIHSHYNVLRRTWFASHDTKKSQQSNHPNYMVMDICLSIELVKNLWKRTLKFMHVLKLQPERRALLLKYRLRTSKNRLHTTLQRGRGREKKWGRCKRSWKKKKQIREEIKQDFLKMMAQHKEGTLNEVIFLIF
jgi:hypothetical protein